MFSPSLHHHCNAHNNERCHVNPLCPWCRSLCVWFRRVTVSFSSPPLIPSFVPPAAITSHGLSSFSISVPQVILLLFFFISLSLHALYWCQSVCLSVCLLTALFVFPVILFLLQLNLSFFLKREVSQAFWWPSDNSSFTCLFVRLQQWRVSYDFCHCLEEWLPIIQLFQWVLSDSPWSNIYHSSSNFSFLSHLCFYCFF